MEPKRLSLEAANQQLAAAEDRLRAVQNKIAALEEALVKLKAEYTRATDAKLRCQVTSFSFFWMSALFGKDNIALATMGASCGTFHIGICLISVLHGVKA